MGVWTSAIGIQSCTTNTDQQSGYDCLNRLTSLHNTTTTATSTRYAGEYVCWSYDAFGNRTAQTLQTTPCPAQASLPATANYNANNQVTGTSVNAAPAGFSYAPQAMWSMTTETFTGVNKPALSTYTQIGTPTGRWIPGVNDCITWARNAINQSTPHDISIVIYGVPTVIAPNAVVYADGSIH